MKLNKSKKLALIIVLVITAFVLFYFLKIKAFDNNINRSNRTLLSNDARGFDNPVFNSPTNRSRPLGQREFYYPAPASLKN